MGIIPAVVRTILSSACLAVIGGACGHVFAQSPVGLTKTLILTPEKSISVEALKKFEIATGNGAAPVATALAADSLFPIRVRKDDTLEGILREQWKLTPGKDFSIDEWTKQILGIRENEAIAARPGKLKALQPGDTLYIPSTVAGMRKTGSIAVLAPANVDPEALLRSTFGDAPLPSVQEAAGVRIASLSNVGVCPDAQGVAPFDAANLASRVKLAEKRPPQGPGNPDGRIIPTLLETDTRPVSISD
jgi:hypothetical protein